QTDQPPDHAQQAPPLTPKDPPSNLVFSLRHLDDPDPEVARDAFLEFAKAGDAEVSAAARKLPAGKLRDWLKDPATPPERLGLYAMLLGAAGQRADAALLRSLLDKKEERFVNAAAGLLAGYLLLEPGQGSDLPSPIP